MLLDAENGDCDNNGGGGGTSAHTTDSHRGSATPGTRTNDDLLPVGNFGTNFTKILIRMEKLFAFADVSCKISGISTSLKVSSFYSQSYREEYGHHGGRQYPHRTRECVGSLGVYVSSQHRTQEVANHIHHCTYRLNGPCGKFKIHDDVMKWKHIPRIRASGAELWCFLWSASE